MNRNKLLHYLNLTIGNLQGEKETTIAIYELKYLITMILEGDFE